MIETILIIVIVLGGGGWACRQIYQDFRMSKQIEYRLDTMRKAEQEYAQGELNGAFQEISRRQQ